MNKKLSKEDLKWEDDSYLMREIHEKFVKVDDKKWNNLNNLLF